VGKRTEVTCNEGRFFSGLTIDLYVALARSRRAQNPAGLTTQSFACRGKISNYRTLLKRALER
jgi:hypothetical protein